MIPHPLSPIDSYFPSVYRWNPEYERWEYWTDRDEGWTASGNKGADSPRDLPCEYESNRKSLKEAFYVDTWAEPYATID